MKPNLFLDRSKSLIRLWIIFAIVWGIITFLQKMSRASFTGYATLFNNHEYIGKTSFEVCLGVFAIIFFCSWWLMEIWKTRLLIVDYYTFVRSKNKNNKMKKILYKMKISLFFIIIGLAISIPAGTIHMLNWITVVSVFTAKVNYVYQYKQLINILIDSEDHYVFQTTPTK